MTKKPTYEDLEKRINTLEKATIHANPIESGPVELHEKFRVLFNNSIFSITYISPEGRIRSMNQVAAKILSGQPEAFTHKFLHEILPRMADEIMARVREAVSSGKSSVYDHHIELPLESHWFISEYQPMKNKKGEIVEVQIISKDVTERKKTEEQVVIFQKLASYSEQGFGMADLNGTLNYINPALCRHLGETKPQDAIGKNLHIYYPEKHRQILEEEGLPTVMEKGHWTGELDFVSIRGRITHTIQNIFLVRDKARKPFFLAVVITDITEHRRLENLLMQREKLQTLGAIAAEVSHEIRNPLVSIGGFARRLKTKFPDSYESDIILKECKRLEEILARIKDYLDPIELHPRECSIDEIIHECLTLLSPETKAKQIGCTLEFARELPTVFADPQILSQIFITLIRTVMKAMNYGGELIIKSSESDQDIHTELKNPDARFTVKNPEAMFLPFAEEDQSQGLPLCYRLVKDMGGFLTFDQDNGSAVFTVSIPKKGQSEKP